MHGVVLAAKLAIMGMDMMKALGAALVGLL
jgi:hypothetical protein